jgi:hypothetical protein
MDDAKEEYRAAYEAWMAQLTDLHKVLLDGERLSPPPKLKGLLNREARAFEEYEAARKRLLGISE